MKKNDVKYIALYLPQFHTFKENDEWWGKGFTEWTNTKPAKKLFEGHYQPHVPHNDIGYYDLSDVNVMVNQAKMAKEYGIYGFCYYFYWFNGKKLMEKPLENMLKTQEVDIPFCLFWANHNWTRAWDTGNKEVLIEQTYDDTTNERFIDDLVPYFKDKRYIKIDNRPIFLVYESDKLPNPKETVVKWRKYAKEKYNIDLYLITVQQNNLIQPKTFGYDAALEGAPNFLAATKSRLPTKKCPKLNEGVSLTFYDYYTDAFIHILRDNVNYKLYKTVYPNWDNTPRRKEKGGWLFYGFTLELYKKFLAEITKFTISHFNKNEQFVFINAWNEWAEGAHLEPDEKYGYKILEITKEISNMSAFELDAAGFNKKEKELMKRKLFPIKFFSKEKEYNKRIIKIFNLPIIHYWKKV